MLTYDDLNDLLAETTVLLNASELHGVLCGRLSTGENLSNLDLDRLLIELLDTSPDVLDQIKPGLRQVYADCVGQIQHQGFDFAPLLPDDGFPLQERTEALGEWCQGYLYGLGGAGADLSAVDVEDVADVLKDLTAFAKLQASDADDDDESSYMELVEYIRVAVLLVHAHLDVADNDQQPVLH